MLEPTLDLGALLLGGAKFWCGWGGVRLSSAAPVPCYAPTRCSAANFGGWVGSSSAAPVLSGQPEILWPTCGAVHGLSARADATRPSHKIVRLARLSCRLSDLLGKRCCLGPHGSGEKPGDLVLICRCRRPHPLWRMSLIDHRAGGRNRETLILWRTGRGRPNMRNCSYLSIA